MEINSRLYQASIPLNSARSQAIRAENQEQSQAASIDDAHPTQEMEPWVERLIKGTPVSEVIVLDKSFLRKVPSTPEEMAARAAEMAAYQDAYEKFKSDHETWLKDVSNFESNEVYFSNIAVMDLESVRSEARVVKIFMENGMLEGRHINAFNGDQKTSSIQEYLSWIYQRIETLEGEATP